MPQSRHHIPDILRWIALLTATAVVSLLFFGMVKGYLVALLLAAILASTANPIYVWFLSRFGGRSGWASGATMLVLAIIVIGPVLTVVFAATAQAIAVAGEIRELMAQVEAGGRSISAVPDLPAWIPFRQEIMDFWPRLLGKIGELAQAGAGFLVASLSAVTLGAATFILESFVFAFSLFFFLQMETPIVEQLLRFTGLSPTIQKRIADRIASVSRATLRGSLLIGVIQGSLGGLGFVVVGFDGAIFWAVVMGIAAMVPGFGAPGVVAGGAIWLMIHGDFIWGGGLFLYAITVVATIDNLVRPRLVGRDARIHDVLILISTLGGLAFFGGSGLIVGPVVAGVFVTIWTILAEQIEAERLKAEQEDGDCQSPEPRSDAG